ncbi:uncharacterized protein LOC144446863 [Glandiceps talaboti]
MGRSVIKTLHRQQGVRQCGIWSPAAYKMFLNPLLNQVSDSELGFHIGYIHCGAVALADDLTFLSDTTLDLQCLMSIQEQYANKNRYLINCAKTKVITFTSKKKLNLPDPAIKFNNEYIDIESECQHVGIIRSSATIES